MTVSTAAFYVASPGYLFQTAVSALQARTHLPASAQVIVFFISGGTPVERDELDAFGTVLATAGVELRELPPTVLRGMAFTYSRFFVVADIDPGVRNLVYLDGDTQILGPLEPLVSEDPGREILAAPDPMVAVRRAGGRLAAKVDGIFDTSQLPAGHRDSYVNAGVMLAARETFTELGEWSQRAVADAGHDFPFRDQDAVNLGFRTRIRQISTAWNFPGFMYGTPAWRSTRPRIVHYMSNPRPWFGVYRPFGTEPFTPYRDLAAAHPGLARYWQRPKGRQAVKSRAVEAYKQVVEAPYWRSPKMTSAMESLEVRAGVGERT